MGEQEKENKPKTHKALKFFLILIIVSGILGAVYLKSVNISIIDYILSYQSDKIVANVLDTQTFDIDSKSDFTVINNTYVECNKDSIKYNGINKWSQTYTMDSPTMISEGNIIAVGEFNKNNVYVFDEKGLLYDITSEAPISQFVVNQSGHLIVMTENSISLYTPYSNPAGAKITSFERETEGVYPICADISNDGDYVAISYLDTTGSQMNSKVLFYAVGLNGEVEYGADSVVNLSSIHGDNELIFNVSYMDNDTLVAISDKKIFAASNNEKIWEKTLTNKLTALNLNNNKYIVLGLGDELPGGSQFKSGTAVWYDLKGNQVGSYELGKDIKNITSKANRVLLYAGKTVYGLSLRGNLLWEYLTLGDLKHMELFNDTSNILLVYRNSAKIIDIKLKFGKNKKETESSQNSTDQTQESTSQSDSTESESSSSEETTTTNEETTNEETTQEQETTQESQKETTSTETSQTESQSQD